MRHWTLRRASAGRRSRPAPYRPAVEALEDRRLLSHGFVQTALVSDVPGLAGPATRPLRPGAGGRGGGGAVRGTGAGPGARHASEHPSLRGNQTSAASPYDS